MTALTITLTLVACVLTHVAHWRVADRIKCELLAFQLDYSGISRARINREIDRRITEAWGSMQFQSMLGVSIAILCTGLDYYCYVTGLTALAYLFVVVAYYVLEGEQ